ncbi:MAG: hypothetical protein HYR72_12190 [Deltaproteobacteria bacterium]|nr:hypothetical protein [Deltaproteobacteria bacterium]MBI3387784.1 hypothetical protein [Deltaproteobacteria bacterium]
MNRHSQRVVGIRYEVILMASEESKPRDTLRYRTDTTIEAGKDAPLKLDVESMYFGSDTRVLIRALPAKVGDRELPLPPGWRE